MGLGLLVKVFFSHLIHKAKEVGPQSTKGSFPRMQGSWFLRCKDDGFASEPSGIMEVAMWLLHIITTWALMMFGFDTQLCCVGYKH
jgi:hypothetical protein